MSDSKTYSVIHWIEIYSVDSVIQPFNNWGWKYIEIAFQWFMLCCSLYQLELVKSHSAFINTTLIESKETVSPALLILVWRFRRQL